MDKRLETWERRAIAGKSWADFGAIITVRDMAEAVALSDRIAPEHLELCTTDADDLAQRVTHAGAIFIGGWTPEAIGDSIDIKKSPKKVKAPSIFDRPKSRHRRTQSASNAGKQPAASAQDKTSATGSGRN